MSLPHIKLIWGASARLKANWHLGLFGSYRRDDGGPWALAVSVRGALGWMLALSTVAYFAGAAMVLQILKGKPYNSVTYADLVLPWQWSLYTPKRGQDAIADGLDQLRKNNFGAAFQQLNAGLARYPQSTKARLVLAEFALARNNRRQAEQLLQAGLAYGYPGRDYLGTICQLAASGENFDLWLAVCDTGIAQLAGKPQLADDRQWLVRQKFSALIAAGRAAEAVRLAETEGETQSSVMREFKVLALLQAGQAAAALDFLADWRARLMVPEQAEQVQRLQVRAFREAGQLADMDRVLEELRAARPAAPAPYVYAIVQRLLAGQTDAATDTFQAFLHRFSSRVENLTMLAEPLAEIGAEPMLVRLLDTARAQGLPLLPLQRALVAASMKNGRWAAAAATVAEMKPKIAPNDPNALFWLEWTTRTLAATSDPSDGAQTSLVGFARELHLPLRLYRDTITALRLAGRAATAQQIATLARRIYPDNAGLSDLEGELATEIAQQPAPAKPAASAAAALAAGAETPFFKALAATMQAGDATTALAQIRAARAAHPAWLDARAEELAGDEILLTARLHDVVALTTAATRYLNGSAARSLAALELAKQLHTADTRPESLVLVRAVLGRMPGFQPAARLLAEWEPSAPGVAAAATALGSEAQFFKTLAAAMETSGAAEEALTQIRRARAARPPWLDARDDELRRDEMLLNARLHDAVALTTTARLYLNGSTARSQAAIELAKQLHTGDTLAESLLLLKEVLKKVPAYAPATRLLAEWEPPIPAATPGK